MYWAPLRRGLFFGVWHKPKRSAARRGGLGARGTLNRGVVVGHRLSFWSH